VRVSDKTPVPGAAANLGIINVRLALADRPALTGVRKSGNTPSSSQWNRGARSYSW
jgi:hypothetical protein